MYETEALLHQYLLFHYGEAREVLPFDFGPKDALGYPVRIVDEFLDRGALSQEARGLDVGCAVGRTSFELARHCAEVVGVDLSSRFIEAARELQQAGEFAYPRKLVGTIASPAMARVPEEINRRRVSFEVGDAHALRPELVLFDVVVAANLLCRMQNPRAFLHQAPALVRAGGQLIIGSPQTWDEEYTPRANWLGAQPHTGDPLDVLTTILSRTFELRVVRNVPFLIREHARKYQWSVAQVTVWRRRLRDVEGG